MCPRCRRDQFFASGGASRLADQKANLQQEINRLKSGEKDPWVVRDLETHIEYLQKRIQATEEELQDFMDLTPGLKAQHKLLTFIPGLAT